jgi:hypothetical protein
MSRLICLIGTALHQYKALYCPNNIREKKIGHKGELYWEERWDIIGKFVPPLPLPSPPRNSQRGKSCASI